jgi:hypothetical protein
MLLCALVVLAIGSSTAHAALSLTKVSVGSGSSTAHVYIGFKDLANYDFEVKFDGSQTGVTLFDIIEAETTLTTDRQDYGFGVFINGISYDGHSNIGYGGGEDWWHYFTRDDPNDPFVSSAVGAADRTIVDGSEDSWRYGWASPIPEPAGVAIAGLGGLALLARRRRV